jgi:hypothetical protein
MIGTFGPSMEMAGHAKILDIDEQNPRDVPFPPGSSLACFIIVNYQMTT